MNNTTNQSNMSQRFSGGYRYDLSSTRLWIKIVNILGTIMAIIGVGIYYYYAFDKNNKAMLSDDVAKLLHIDLNSIPSIIIMIVVNFIFLSSIILCIALVHFVSSASDDDLISIFFIFFYCNDLIYGNIVVHCVVSPFFPIRF